MFYLFICLLRDLPYFCISQICSHSPLNCTTAHCTATLPLSTFLSTLPQPTALLPSHSAHFAQLYRSPLHCRCRLAHSISNTFPILSLASCRLHLCVHSFRSTSVPYLYTIINLRQSTCFMWNPRSRIFVAFNIFFCLPRNYCDLSCSESCRSQLTHFCTSPQLLSPSFPYRLFYKCYNCINYKYIHIYTLI